MSQLTTGQTAPDFSTIDVTGKAIRLNDFGGKTVLLAFQRFAGCPVCNVRFHEFQKHRAELRAKGIEVLAVYESSAQTLQQYLDSSPTTSQPYAQLLPDPNEALYRLYGVERSINKLLSGVMLHGGFGKLSASKKLNPNLPKQEGHVDRVGADFLIDPSGRISRAHYHRFVGDDLPLTEVLATAEVPKVGRISAGPKTD